MSYSLFNKKLQGTQKRQKTQFEGTEQTSEPESYMAGMLKLSDQECKNTRISLLWALMEKINNMQEQMDNKQRGENCRNE